MFEVGDKVRIIQMPSSFEDCTDTEHNFLMSRSLVRDMLDHSGKTATIKYPTADIYYTLEEFPWCWHQDLLRPPSNISFFERSSP